MEQTRKMIRWNASGEAQVIDESSGTATMPLASDEQGSPLFEYELDYEFYVNDTEPSFEDNYTVIREA